MRKIQLTNGKISLVDDEDFEYLNKWKWYYKKGYATRSGLTQNGKQTKLSMHRVLMNTPVGMHTDHIDGDTLNNQKYNLRICTPGQNQMNKKKMSNGKASKFKGVGIRKIKKNLYYRTQILAEGKYISKYFPFTPDGEILAAKAYNELATKHFGEFACLNEV